MSADEPKRGALGEGAAWEAPTAPHATPPERGAGRTRSGPERFWAKGPVRVALAVGLAVSVIAHSALLPIRVPAAFEVKDLSGEAAIPIDLLDPGEASDPPLTEPNALPSPPSSKEDDKMALSASASLRSDGGARSTHDAGETENSATDGGSDAGSDASGFASGIAATDASADDSGAAVAAADDPHAVTGAVAAIAPKVINVVLVINAEVIRSHPVAPTLAAILRGIPQWNDFMSGTAIDPVRDTDWVMVSGPSLVKTESDVVLIHYSATDAAIDRAVAIVSHKYGHGGPVDTGVPGVKAVLAHADRAERVIMRPQPHVLVVVPPADAAKVARQLVRARVKAPLSPGEAVYLRLVNPQRPLPELPDSITELRLRVVPRHDAGADVFVEGDTDGPESATRAANAVAKMVRRHNDMFTALLTHGLLDHVEVTSEGNLVKLRLSATLDQIQTLAALVGSLLGVAPPGATVPPLATPPPPLDPAGRSSPRGSFGPLPPLH